jgi:hypothetical protein
MRPPNQTIYVLAAQSRTAVTIHIIRAEVSMSRAADNVSPTAVMYLRRWRSYENANARFFTGGQNMTVPRIASRMRCGDDVCALMLEVGSDPKS